MPKPLISVIIPVYNTEKYLRQCLMSIASQTYRDFEVILVDDGSTDSSGSICDSFAEDHPNFVCIHKENGGQSSARLAGANASSGEYIACIDSDDWIREDAFLAISEKILAYHPDMLLYDALRVDAAGRVIRNVRSDIAAGLYTRDRIEREILPGIIDNDGGPWFPSSLWGEVIQRDIFLSAQSKVDSRIRIEEDLLIVTLCMLQAKSFYSMQDQLYYYRLQPNSVLHTESDSYVDNLILFRQCMSKLTDTRCFSFSEQLDRHLAHMAFSCMRRIAKKTSEYREFKQRIIPILDQKECRTSIRNASFSNRRFEFKRIMMRYRCWRLFWLIWKNSGGKSESYKVMESSHE